MPDLFISYAREDVDLVRRLHAALVTARRDVWVDAIANRSLTPREWTRYVGDNVPYRAPEFGV